ncbi:MAG: hypothetical protein WC229_01405 [Candidatus Paceibacterota bacterium]|jgi:hypothetical protein
MENLPKFEVIGNVPEEEKDKYRSYKKDIFIKQGEMLPKERAEELNALEQEKTPEEIVILNLINEETSRLMKECGVEPFDIPIQNYHILPPEGLKKFFGTDSDGVYKNYAVGLSSELRSSLLDFATTAFHESLHMKSRSIWELYEDEKGKIKHNEYRGGVRSFSPNTKDEKGIRVGHFSGLDEAIVSWQEKIFLQKFLSIPELAKEKQVYDSEENKLLRQKIAKKRGLPEDEILGVDSSSERVLMYGYYGHRRVLEYVCEEISKEFDDKYQSREDVFKDFLRSNFDGNLILIARLMKQTFGDMGLRALSTMRIGYPSGGIENLLEMLRKMRRNVLNGKK